MSNTDQHRGELADLFTEISQMVDDTRVYQTRDVNTLYTFPAIPKPNGWRKRQSFGNIFWSATG